MIIQCPICKTNTKEANQEYCYICAWEFEYFLGELSESERRKYDGRLKICKEVFTKSSMEPKVMYKEKEVEINNENIEKDDDTVVIDGLMYQSQPLIDTYTWDEAIGYAKDLRLEKYDDWRLPTVIELQKLLVQLPNTTLNNKEIYIKKEFSIHFEEYNWVWTVEDQGLAEAGYINFFTGRQAWNKKIYKGYVLCVR